MHKDAYAGALSKFSSTTARTPASDVRKTRPRKISKGWQTHKIPFFTPFRTFGVRLCRRENPYRFSRHPPSFFLKNALRQTKSQIPVTPMKGPLYFFYSFIFFRNVALRQEKKRKHPPTTKRVNAPLQPNPPPRLKLGKKDSRKETLHNKRIKSIYDGKNDSISTDNSLESYESHKITQQLSRSDSIQDIKMKLQNIQGAVQEHLYFAVSHEQDLFYIGKIKKIEGDDILMKFLEKSAGHVEAGHDSSGSKKVCPRKMRKLKGSHTSFSCSCPSWIFEKEVISEKVTKRISYLEAKRTVKARSPTSGTSYATAVQKTVHAKYTQIIPVVLSSDSVPFKISYTPSKFCPKSSESFIKATAHNTHKVKDLSQPRIPEFPDLPDFSDFKSISNRKRLKKDAKMNNDNQAIRTEKYQNFTKPYSVKHLPSAMQKMNRLLNFEKLPQTSFKFSSETG
ncbi:hypothetical protein AVEN_128009-1 [Araneus ventricosus]|uniref:Uncharacterized protein n=1 Tax=Araneus ventricosus TaxID=182803 RepID=A0A4Y1ZZ99_ARAVE|nr:hypothetical protein AVEN_128009-1 [Araneus ventricosus]